jgi:hypothetical protein
MSIIKSSETIPIGGEHVASVSSYSPQEQERVCNLIADALLKSDMTHLGYDMAKAAVIGFLVAERMELAADNFERWVAYVSNRIGDEERI